MGKRMLCVAGGRIAVPVLAALLAMLLVLAGSQSAFAAGYKASEYTGNSAASSYTVKVGKATFKASDTGQSLYSLVMYRGGKWEVLATKIDGRFITNGKYVFYAKRGARVTSDESSQAWQWDHRKHTIYRLNVKTGAKKKIASGTNVVPRGCSGSYLYYGKYQSANSDYNNLYALNMKTGKKKSLAGHNFDGFCGTRVVCHVFVNPGTAIGAPLYTYKKNGTGKVRIAKRAVPGYVKIQGKRITYMVTRGVEWRVYGCSATGKGKKALTDWSDDFSYLEARYF